MAPDSAAGDSNLREQRDLDFAGLLAALMELHDREVTAWVEAQGSGRVLEASGILEFGFDAASAPAGPDARVDLTQGVDSRDSITYRVGGTASFTLRRRQVREAWRQQFAMRVIGSGEPWMSIGVNLQGGATLFIEEDADRA